VLAPGLAKDRSSRIAVVARRGHFRDSLVALLRNLSRVEIVALDFPLLLGDAYFSQGRPPDIVVLVTEGLALTVHEALPALRGDWPEARFVVLVDHVWRVGQGQDLGVDCILAKCAPAGEILPAIREQLRDDPYYKDRDPQPASPALERSDALIPTIS
jgi:DNA-binding NarL/FixJ family response regulator